MRRYILALILVLYATPAFAQASVVAEAKADLERAGVSLSGACGALRIANLVAWRLAPRYGLLHKAGGNRAILKADGSCLTGEQSNDPEGYATDYLIERATGHGFDTLQDGGTLNNPMWLGPESAPDMVSRNWNEYREPVDPTAYLTVSAPPVVPPVVLPNQPPAQPPVIVLPSTDLSPVLNELAIQRTLLENVKAQIEAFRADTAAWQESVRSKWGAATKFAAKYILPAVAGVIGGWKMK